MLTLDEQIKYYKKSIWMSFLNAILFIIFALVLFFKEEDIITTSILVIGFIGLVFGCFSLLKFFKTSREDRIYRNDFLQGILLILFGGIALLKNTELANMIAFLIGAYLIYHNAVRMQICLHFDGLNQGHFWKYLAGISAGCILSGIMILLNPFDEIAISHVIAVCLIVSEGVNIFQNIAMLIGMGREDEKQTSKE
ncbi:MAG: hypothetical protein HFI09_01830 [Bacilli bacterium]|nr:hypothetical protein [Bacilli bacterium]